MSKCYYSKKVARVSKKLLDRKQKELLKLTEEKADLIDVVGNINYYLGAVDIAVNIGAITDDEAFKRCEKVVEIFSKCKLV